VLITYQITSYSFDNKVIFYAVSITNVQVVRCYGQSIPLGNLGGKAAGGAAGGAAGVASYPNLKKALAICAKLLFGVDLVSFTASQPGQDGQFTGYGPDSWFHGGNDAQFTVRTDSASFTSAQLNEQWSKAYGKPVPIGSTVLGLTWPDSPFTNSVANNLTSLGTVVNQAHELGHSLHNITTGSKQEKDFDFGKAMQDCVSKNGGFRSQ
jgi:hypothetical protein